MTCSTIGIHRGKFSVQLQSEAVSINGSLVVPSNKEFAGTYRNTYRMINFMGPMLMF